MVSSGYLLGVIMNSKWVLAAVAVAVLLFTSSVVVLGSEDTEATEAGTAEDFESILQGDGTYITIDLTANITFDGNVNISKRVTIDLNGYDITFSSGGFVVTNRLTVQDSNASDGPVVDSNYDVEYDSGCISSPGVTIRAVNGGTVNIQSGHIESGDIALYAGGNTTPGGTGISSSVTVTGGYITSQEFALSPQGNGASVTVSGGVLEARDNAVIGGNGTMNVTTDLGGTSITVSGGTLIGHITTSGYVACGIYAPNHGSVTVTGGTIYADGGVGILARAGTVEILDGDIIATGGDDILGKVGDSRVVVTASAVIVDEEAGYPGADNGNDLSVTIRGGHLSSEIDGVVRQIGGDSATTPRILVDGGYFSSAPGDDFLRGNIFNTTTGEVTIPLDDAVVVVNDTIGYPSLYDAFNNCQETDMDIVFRADDSLDRPIIIPSGTEVSLDLAGHELSMSATITVNSGASLSITSSVDGGRVSSSTDGLNVYGTLEMSNVDMTSALTAIYITGTADISNSSVETTSNQSGEYAISLRSGGEATVTDGTVRSNGGYAIYVYGSTLTVTGGEVSSSSRADIYGNVNSIIAIGTTGVDADDVELDWIETYMAVYRIYIDQISNVTGSRFSEGSEFECVFLMDVTSFVPGDMMCNDLGNGQYEIVELTQDRAVAGINGKYYSTLPLAASAMVDGDTLTLYQNYTGEDTIVLNVYNGVLDMQQYSITVTDDEIGVDVHPNNFLTPPESIGVVTIRGSEGSQITADVPVNVQCGGTGSVSVAFDGVTLTSNIPNGGLLEMGQGASLVYDEENSDWYYELIKVGGFFATDANGTTYIFGGVNDALDVDVNRTATLMNDLDGTLTISKPGAWTIDLNGKTISVDDGEGLDISSGSSDITVRNGTISGVDGISIGITFDNDSVTFENVTIESSGDYGIVSNGTHCGIEITLRNSTVNAAEWGIYFPSDGTLTIEDSVINAGTTGVEIRAGTLNVSGENTNITARGEFNAVPNGNGTTTSGVAIAVSKHTTDWDLTANISGGTFSGKYAVYENDLHGTSEGTIAMSITGGTFTGETAPVYSADLSGFISGGTFGGSVDGYVAPGCSATQNGDGIYTVARVQTSSSLTVSDDTPEQGDSVTATFSIDGVSSEGATFSWTFNGTAVSGVTGNTYTFTAERSGTIAVSVTIDVQGESRTFTGSVDITVIVPTIPSDPDEGETTVTIDEDGNRVTETTRPDGSSTVTTERPTQTVDDNRVTETVVEETDSEGNTTTTTTTEYESVDGSSTTTVTDTVMPDGSSSQTSQTTIQADDTADVAVVTGDRIDAAVGQMESVISTGAEMVFTITSANEHVSLPTNISQVTDSGATLVVSSTIGSVTVNSTVVDTLLSDDLDVVITQRDASHTELNASQQQAVDGNRVIELSASNQNRQIHQLGDYVAVTIDGYELPAGVDSDSVRVFYVDDSGRLTEMRTQYDTSTGTVTFWTDHFSYYVIGDTGLVSGDEPVTPPFNPGWDDGDDVVVPPTIVYEDSGSGDDTIKVAACVAAVVAAAIIALILVAEYRKR